MKSEVLPERMAIIEFDSSHDECLLTQINALKKHGSWVMLVTNSQVRSRNQYLENLVDEWNEIDPKGKELSGAAIGDAMIIWRLMRSLKKNKVNKVIFNTAQGGHVRNACLFSLFSKMEFIGIIHTIRKFQGSFTQRLISWKIKKYFVLAEFLKEQVISTPASKLQIKSFYPLDFPKNDSIVETDDTLHISIIGSVEPRRKDLKGFLSLIQQTDKSVRFHFLGKADPKSADVIKLKEDLGKMGSTDRVEFFENRVEFQKMNEILRKSIAILPLVHPNTPSADEYFRNQIPGAMSVALGYKLPLLLHAEYTWIEELVPASISYEISTFHTTIDRLKLNGKDIQLNMIKSENYSSDKQYETYLNVLFCTS